MPGKRCQPPLRQPAAVAGRLRRILLAVDGSEASQKAVQQVLAMRGELRDPAGIELHVVNVQRPVSGDVSSFVAKQSLQEYYDERSEAALQSARGLLQGAGAIVKEHRSIGIPGATIAELARSEGCDMIVMGTRGLGSHTAALVGSVAQSTLEHASVPVLLVR